MTDAPYIGPSRPLQPSFRDTWQPPSPLDSVIAEMRVLVGKSQQFDDFIKWIRWYLRRGIPHDFNVYWNESRERAAAAHQHWRAVKTDWYMGSAKLRDVMAAWQTFHHERSRRATFDKISQLSELRPPKIISRSPIVNGLVKTNRTVRIDGVRVPVYKEART